MSITGSGETPSYVSLAIQPASERMRAIAATQIKGASEADGSLVLHRRRPSPCLSDAFQIRRWSLSISPELPRPTLALAWSEERSTDGEERARSLAAAGPAGGILAEPGILEAADRSWLGATAAELGDGSDAVQLHWSGPGAPAAGGAPLPAPILGSLDRPWAMLGREPELEAIARRWAAAVGGGGAMRLLAGEPGVGKTRLVAESAQEVQRAGGLVLYGSGENPAPGAFGPFGQAFAQLTSQQAALGLALSDSPLARLIDDSREQPPLPGGLGDDRGALFKTAVEGLEWLSSQRPVLLVIEDLHACSASSLRLLEHLAQEVWALPVLVLATYRATDIAPGDERAQMLARLHSLAGGDHRELPALSARNLTGIAAALNPEAESGELTLLAERAHAETEGNALFACELLRGAGTPAGIAGESLSAPRSLRMLIAARARGLGEDVFEHLCAGAVAGRSFEPELVAESWGRPSTTCSARQPWASTRGC